jgi:hypothetical protein
MGSGVRKSEEDWKRQINWSYNTYMHGNNSRKLPVSLYLKLAKHHVSLLHFFFYKIREQEGRQVSAWGWGEVAGKGAGG